MLYSLLASFFLQNASKVSTNISFGSPPNNARELVITLSSPQCGSYPNVVGRVTAKRKVAGSNLATNDFSTCNPTYLQLLALWVLGKDENWGVIPGRQMKTIPSLTVLSPISRL
jgi:hypothetical protein